MFPELRLPRTTRSRIRPSMARSCRMPAAIAISLIVAGCSADVTRFDTSLLGANEGGGRVDPDQAYAESRLSEATPANGYVGGGDYGRTRQTAAVETGTIRRDGLDPPRAAPVREPHASDRGGAGQSYGYAPRNTAPAARQPLPSSPAYETYAPRPTETRRTRVADAVPGDSGIVGSDIEVQPGDTLYGLARRHGVSVDDLKNANGLSGNTIRVGQRLMVPGARGGQSGSVASHTPTRPALPRAPRATDTFAGESYTVQPGDSLYRISRMTNTQIADLREWNGIEDVRALRPGMTLRLTPPESGQRFASREAPNVRQTRTETIRVPRSTSSETAPAGEDRRVSDARVRVPQTRLPGAVTPNVINGRSEGRQVASNDASAGLGARETPTLRPPEGESAATGSGFRWPVRGKVISGFGPRKDGSHNDGIDIAVPMGTPIKATDDGIVAYAGNELKGYGNLVLIRHDNGWVSAYAHASELLVRRGDAVKRGQVIAKAGNSGAVDQPMLHFELRDGAKPVDPLPKLGS